MFSVIEKARGSGQHRNYVVSYVRDLVGIYLQTPGERKALSWSRAGLESPTNLPPPAVLVRIGPRRNSRSILLLVLNIPRESGRIQGICVVLGTVVFLVQTGSCDMAVQLVGVTLPWLTTFLHCFSGCMADCLGQVPRHHRRSAAVSMCIIVISNNNNNIHAFNTKDAMMTPTDF